MKKFKKNPSGQSLLEAIFAIGVMTIVVASVLALVNASISGQKESESQIIANNLAREGIEVARNIRDSNWLAGANWDNGLVSSDPAQNRAIAEFSSAGNSWQLTFGCDNKQLYISADGIYTHADTGTKSVYSRCLTLTSICQTAAGTDVIKDFCAEGENKIGLKINSTVDYQDSGQQRSVSLEDLLYAWK